MKFVGVLAAALTLIAAGQEWALSDADAPEGKVPSPRAALEPIALTFPAIRAGDWYFAAQFVKSATGSEAPGEVF